MVETVPQISILMANYNNANYLACAIESVLKQTFVNWELIIFDDCSTDNSVNIIKKYLNDKRIRFYQNEKNLGFVKTLKKLVEFSRADLLGLLDSDDFLVSEAIETAINVSLNKPDYAFFYSRLMHCDNDLKPIKIGRAREIEVGKTDLQLDCVDSFKVFRKNCYYDIGGFDDTLPYIEDYDFILRVEEKYKLFFMDKVLYYYRFVPSSLTNHPQKNSMARIYIKIVRYNAYKRRLGTNIPNFSHGRALLELLKGFYLSLKILNKEKIIFFVKEIFLTIKRIF